MLQNYKKKNNAFVSFGGPIPPYLVSLFLITMVPHPYWTSVHTQYLPLTGIKYNYVFRSVLNILCRFLCWQNNRFYFFYCRFSREPFFFNLVYLKIKLSYTGNKSSGLYCFLDKPKKKGICNYSHKKNTLCCPLIDPPFLISRMRL